MPSRPARHLIRVLVGATLLTALLACALTRIPDDLPAVALGQANLYRLEILLFVFYSGLLLITPLFSGLIGGRLPTEISTRGARFAEGAERSAGLDDAAIARLEASIDDLAEALANAQIDIDLLKQQRQYAARDRFKQ